jgi:hypothetical protein
LYAPILAVALFWLMAAVGRGALQRMGVATHLTDGWERGFAYTAVGAGFLQYAPFVLGLCGLLSVTALRVTVVALAVIYARHIAAVARGVIALRPARRPALLVAWCVVLCAFIGALLVRAVVVGNFGDDDGYHLLAPKRWLASGSLPYLPTYTHTNAPMGFEMIYAIGLATGGPSVAKMMNFGAGLLLLLGVGLCARRLGYSSAGVLAVSLLLLENRFVDLPVLMTLAYTDMATCWMTIATVLAWLVWREREDTRILVLVGLCAGFAGSFKFTGLWVGAAICVVLFLTTLREPEPFFARFWKVVMTGVLALLPVAPWLWRNSHLTGNPVYPVLSSIFPTRGWSPEHAAIFVRYFRYYNWGQEWPHFGDSERRLILILAAGAIFFLYAVAIVLAKRRVFRELLFFAALLTATALPVTGLYYRFLLPGTICAVVVLACLCVERLRSERWLLAIATLILAAGVWKWSTWGRYGWLENLQVTAGLAQEQRTDQFWQTWQYINTSTPPDARVLMAAFYPSFHQSSGTGFWVDRATYTTDSHLQNDIQLQDWSAFVASVRDAGIDFVVFCDQAPADARPGFSTYPGGRNEYPFGRRLVEDYGTRVFRAGNLSVYRLAIRG